MGNASSSTPVAGGHSGVPQDPVPYAGPLKEYRTVVVTSKLKVSFGGGTISEVNEYMQTLGQQYAEYFKLNTFFRVPYSIKRAGMTTVLLTFQAIFSRPAVYVPSPERWQLQVVSTKLKISATMSGALFGSGKVDTSMADIYNCIAQNAGLGGRLICLECSGDRQQGGFVSADFGVNMFFNIPSHPNPVIYSTIAYSVPLQVRQGFRDVDVQMDIAGTLSLHLDQGWKLIDIIVPQHESGLSLAQQKNHRFPPLMNTIWFFEKELSRCNSNDMTPLYQVSVIDVYVPVSVGFGGSTQSQCDLGPLLTEMGQKGWSLVCVLDTPKMQASGMKVTVFLKAFFQRPLQRMEGNVPPSAYAAPPPPYESQSTPVPPK